MERGILFGAGSEQNGVDVLGSNVSGLRASGRVDWQVQGIVPCCASICFFSLCPFN